MEENFYITLLSNVLPPWGENTCAEFLTKLPERKRLTGSWAVGLKSISYTFSWDTLRKPSLVSFYKYEGSHQRYINTTLEKIHAGHYDSIQALITEINQVLVRHMQPLAFDTTKKDKYPYVEIDSTLNRIVFHAGVAEIEEDEDEEKDKKEKTKEKVEKFEYFYFEFSDELMEILGFEVDVPHAYKLVNGRFIRVAERPFDPQGGLHCLLVNTDIIQPQSIGDIFSNTLEILPVPSLEARFGDQIEHRFQDCDFVPLNTNEFEQIYINISTDHGEKVPFQFGRTIVKLKFVKIG